MLPSAHGKCVSGILPEVMRSRGNTGSTQVQSLLNATTATRNFLDLTILPSIWSDKSKKPKSQHFYGLGHCLKDMKQDRWLDFRHRSMALKKKVLNYKCLCKHTHACRHTQSHIDPPTTHIHSLALNEKNNNKIKLPSAF